MADKLRISLDDLNTTQVNDYIEIQDQLRAATDPIDDQPWYIKLIYSSWLYLAVWGLAGAFLGWLLLEPFFDDNSDEVSWGGVFMFPVVSGFIGLFVGMAEGVMCRNAPRAFFNGFISLVIGFLTSLVMLFPIGIAFALIKFAVLGEPGPDGEFMPPDSAFQIVVLVMARSVIWALISACSGMGQGIAQWDRKIVFNGVIGAVLGGALGGILFDPISFISVQDGEAYISRCIGFTTIGAFVGLFIGLVEGWTKTAWLLMRRGPLAGKQFIMHRDVTVLGSSPKAGIYLFKDMDIEPRHAIIYNRGGRFEIEDCQTAAGTYVNGQRVQGRRYIQKGDQIELGKTVLEFDLKSAN